jgi:hypothetical protein
MIENNHQDKELSVVAPTADERAGWTSASNATADGLCVGRHNAQRSLPELPSTPDEIEARDNGLQIHAALASRDPAKLEESQLNTYERCLEIEEKAVKQFFGEEANDLMTVAEERFWVFIENKYRHSAKVDRVYRSKTKALVLEYKTLPGDHATSSSNAQLRDQICLVHGNLLANEIGGLVVQPLVTMTPELVVFNAETLSSAITEMFARVTASNLGSERTAGPIQCAFCRAKFLCPAYEKFTAESMPMMNTFVDSPVDLWTAEQCGVFLERCGMAEKWLDAAKFAIRRRIEAGLLPGWKIGEGDKNFKVTDMNELSIRIGALGISHVDFIKICHPNKEAVTKLVRAATKTKGKGLAAEVEKLFSGICADERKRGSIERVQQPKGK